MVNRRMSNLFTLDLHGDTCLAPELVEQLDSALDDSSDRGRDTVIVLSLHGREPETRVTEWPGKIDIGQVNKWERVLRRIERSPLPLIAIAEHACSALALELLTVADYRIATSSFSLRTTEAGRTVWPGMSLFRLTRQIGESRTRKLFLDRRVVTAEVALGFDLVDVVVPDLAAALESASRLTLEAPLIDFAVRRRLIQDSYSAPYEEALGAHLAACHRSLSGSASDEG
jgi:isomerase DpgB